MEGTQERYLNEHEIARITGRAVPTLRNDRCQCKGLPYVKVGRSVRYSLRDVLAWMEKRKVLPEG